MERKRKRSVDEEVEENKVPRKLEDISHENSTSSTKKKKKNKNKKKLSQPLVVTKVKTLYKAVSQDGDDHNGASPKSTKKKKHQVAITQFHTMFKQLETYKLQLSSSSSPKERDELTSSIASLENQIEKLGGLRAYQEMSIRGEKLPGSTKKCTTATWIVQQLLDFGLKPKSGKLTMLDVGALHFWYTQTWIACTAIDLNPLNKDIVKMDFFEVGTLHEEGLQEREEIEDDLEEKAFKVRAMPRSSLDVLCLSLVINFVGDIHKRGEMLVHTCKLLKLKGHLMVVLPLPCVENSRYFSHALFLEMMQTLGYEVRKSHTSKKLAYYMFQLVNKKAHEDSTRKRFPKKLICPGNKRNNFCIVL